MDIETFIHRWTKTKGGQERANYAPFLCELCDVLGVPRPDPAEADPETNDYVFERVVKEPARLGAATSKRIDLYKRNCFVLEAKQSRQKEGGAKQLVPAQGKLFEVEDSERGRRGASRAWDVLMMNARTQAENYVRLLPADHAAPPFVLVCDVGHCIEVYANFRRDGKAYDQFPDRQGFRVYLEDLRRPEVLARLKAIWTDPDSLDTSRNAARVTRAIAERLAAVSKALEAKQHPPEAVAMFLMRCLFTMFAEDVGLLPQASFKEVLDRCHRDPSTFPHDVGQLWQAMDKGGYAHAIRKTVKRFNGEFFKEPVVLPLDAEAIYELRAAAAFDWRDVEPAIFGTLVEQALSATERKALGAHYTPRAYVERLVHATVIDPLRQDWANVLATVEDRKAAGKEKEAIAAVQGFHDKLCALRVLDPACGTGNFLYVALELVKRLEGEVLEALANLGGQEALAGLEGHNVDPHQFLGLEVNPRAAAIAELVLWIGYLQWHFRTKGGEPAEPILKAFRNIKVQDAVLTPDRTKRPEWPPADFIVGNPPFIGGKDIRARLGDDYATKLWAAHKHMNDSADFVMYWWDLAAELLTRPNTPLRRFGLVTTNSISQVLQRRVMERHLQAKKPISLVMAIPDHPWTKTTKDSAAVRIAMTVVEAGKREGLLQEVVSESGLDSDTPELTFNAARGVIHSDLTVGVDVGAAKPLKANEGLCVNGMKPLGSGFIINSAQASSLGMGKRDNLDKHVKPYRNGKDLTSRPRYVYAIDLWGLSADQVRIQFPEIYQHLVITVKNEREIAAKRSLTRDAQEYADRWWTFCKPRQEMRAFMVGLNRYVVTVQTAKHRVFQFLDWSLMPDQKLMVIGIEDAWILGVLSSSLHRAWTLRTCSWLGAGNDSVYVKVRSFDPFPFPAATLAQQAIIRGYAEELDAHRKRVLEAHPHLTLTGLYNVLERVRAGAAYADLFNAPAPKALPDLDTRKTPIIATVPPLNSEEKRTFNDGLVLILKELHDNLDAAVAAAYGWPADLTDDEVLARLVALNKERAREEARGKVRWLRPDYQIPRFGSVKEKAELALEGGAMGDGEGQDTGPLPVFPDDPLAQVAAVTAAIAASPDPLDTKGLAMRFRKGARLEPRVSQVVAAIARMGYVSKTPDGRFRISRAA